MVLAATVAYACTRVTLEYMYMWLWQMRKAAGRPQASYWTSQCLCLLTLYFSYKIAKGILHDKRFPKSSLVAWEALGLCGCRERTKALEAGKLPLHSLTMCTCQGHWTSTSLSLLLYKIISHIDPCVLTQKELQDLFTSSENSLYTIFY